MRLCFYIHQKKKEVMKLFMDKELSISEQTLKKYHQEHLLRFYDELTSSEKQELLNEINSINFEQVHKLYMESYLDDTISFSRISPLPYISISNLSKYEISKFTSSGENIINNAELGIITLAGGQGTRLGYKGPKGSYEIDVPPRKSLFEFVCDDLKNVYNKYGIYLNWYIMTSPTNDSATRNYFKDKDFFGYPLDKVKFFVQSTFPIIDTDEKIILDTPHTIKTGSNGNGDVFRAFKSAGLLNDLDKNNIKWIFIGGIDNILLKWVDPLFLGLASSGNYSIASKSIKKQSFDDPDWVFANVDNHPSIIDPHNLSISESDTSVQELYNQKNILSHLFTVDAFKSLIDVDLPYHRAFKKNAFINEEGMKEIPEKPNSFKFEKFIFDSFQAFDKLLLLEVDPNEEFAPIKAFSGDATPETALELYKKYNHLK